MDQSKEIEEIKHLKAKYFRFLDAKNWVELDQCLTDEVTFSYPPQQINVQGREALIANFSTRHEHTQTAHTGSMPEIEIVDSHHAKGIWFMTDYVVSPQEDHTLLITQGFGHYFETYVRERGKWKIQSILLERLLMTKPDAKLINIQ